MLILSEISHRSFDLKLDTKGKVLFVFVSIMTKFLNQRLLKDVLGFIALLVLTAMGCGMQNVCRLDNLF